MNLEEYNKTLKSTIENLNKGHSINLITEKNIKDIFDDEFNTFIESSNKNARLQKMWVYSNAIDGENDYIQTTIYLDNNNKYHYTNNQQKSKSLSKELILEHMKYISRKNPKILKAMIKSGYDKYMPEVITDFLNKITSKSFLFSLSNIYKKIDSKNVELFDELLNDFELYDIFKNEDDKKSLIFSKINKDFELLKNIFKKIEKDNNIIYLIESFDMEFIDDIISKREKAHEFNLIISNQLTKENKKLLSNDSLNIIKKLTNEGLTANDFHNDFGKKIAKYKTEEDLFKGLSKYLETIRGWSKDIYINKIHNINLDYEEIENNIIKVKIPNYKASQTLGSANWCISTDEYWFNHYTNRMNRQYFIYDFNKSADDPLSMIGLTVDFEGEIKNSHDKNDTDIASDVHNFKQYFSKLNKDHILDKIINSKVNVFEKVKELKYFKIENNKDEYRNIFKQMIESLKEIDTLSVSPDIMSMSQGMNSEQFNYFLSEIYDYSNGDVFNYETSFELFRISSSKFMNNFFLNKIEAFNNDEKKHFIEDYFRTFSSKTIFRQRDIGGIELLKKIINSNKNNFFVDINKENEVLKDLQVNVIKMVVDDKYVFNELFKDNNIIKKIESVSLYSYILTNNNVDHEIKERVDSLIDNNMRKDIIANLFLKYKEDSLSYLSLDKAYQTNIFEEFNGIEHMNSVDDWLSEYSDDKFNDKLYQDLFDYSKKNNLKFINSNNSFILLNSPKLRKILVKNNLIEPKTYLEMLKFDAHNYNMLFIDKKTTKLLLNYIKENKNDMDFKNIFMSDLFEAMITNEAITAKELKKEIEPIFNHLPQETKDYIDNEVDYEKKIKKKNIKQFRT